VVHPAEETWRDLARLIEDGPNHVGYFDMIKQSGLV